MVGTGSVYTLVIVPFTFCMTNGAPVFTVICSPVAIEAEPIVAYTLANKPAAVAAQTLPGLKPLSVFL